MTRFNRSKSQHWHGPIAVASLVVALGLPVLAQAQDASQRQPTNITPRVGIDNFTGQQGALPQPELTAEQKRLLLQLRIMQIEGGRAYVRQACADPTWVNDYKAQLEEVEVTKRPEAVEAFKIGWNESKARLGPDIVSCETVLPTEG